MSIVFKRLNDLKKVPRGWTLLGSFFQTLKSLRAGTLSLFSLVYFHHWVQCLAGRRWWVYICKEWTDRDFPGGPVVKTSRFHCRGIGMTPCWRTKILPATQCNQKKKKWTEKQMNIICSAPDYRNWNHGQKAWELLCKYQATLPNSGFSDLVTLEAGWDSHTGKDIWLDSVILPSNPVAGPLPWTDRWKISSQEHSLQAGKQGFNAYFKKSPFLL